MLPKNRDYDKRVFRLLSILNKLDAGEKLSIVRLAEEFNTSSRTIQRDIRLLRSTGFLIKSKNKGIYSFEEGFSLKKVSLSSKEASLLSFMHEIAQSLGQDFKDTFGGILKKVIQQEYDSPYYAKILPGADIKKSCPFIQDIEEAIDESQKLNLSYQLAGKIKTYKICPLKIIFYDGFWYLLAQVDTKDWLIKFKLEDIKDAALLNEYFEEPSNLKAMLDKSVNVWFSEKTKKKAVLKIDEEAAPFFRKKRYFLKQRVLKQNRDGSISLEAYFCDSMELIPTVLSWMPHINVIEPKEIKDEIIRIVDSYALRMKRKK